MRPQRGFTFIFVLFLVALTSAGLAILGDVWATTAKREREAELLFVGNAIRQAIGNFYQSSAGSARQYPPSLAALLLDPRFPDQRRYLRQLYPDPMTGSVEWVLIRAPEGGIMGVASTSEGAPLKRARFSVANAVFESLAIQHGDQLRYRDWEFIYQPVQGLSNIPKR